MSLKFDNSSYLGTMLACSLLVHLALIANIKFRAPDLNTFREKIPQLEVVLVNAKTETAPKKASLLAQANLDHGGNSSEKQRAKTPLAAMSAPPKQNAIGTASTTEIAQPSNQTESKPQDSVHLKQEKVRELEQKVKQVMEQANAAATVEKAPSQSSEKAASNPSKPDIKAIVANSLSEAAQYEAELSKEHLAYQERPRREFIGSRAREDRFAFYVEAWRQKVERIGNLNYPQEAKTQKLYGTLILTVSIKADGSIESIEVDKKSNFKVLDDAARRIVELGSPYAPFPDNIRKDTDIIVITRTWSFTREDTWFSQ